MTLRTELDRKEARVAKLTRDIQATWSAIQRTEKDLQALQESFRDLRDERTMLETEIVEDIRVGVTP